MDLFFPNNQSDETLHVKVLDSIDRNEDAHFRMESINSYNQNRVAKSPNLLLYIHELCPVDKETNGYLLVRNGMTFGTGDIFDVVMGFETQPVVAPLCETIISRSVPKLTPEIMVHEAGRNALSGYRRTVFFRPEGKAQHVHARFNSNGNGISVSFSDVYKVYSHSIREGYEDFCQTVAEEIGKVAKHKTRIHIAYKSKDKVGNYT